MSTAGNVCMPLTFTSGYKPTNTCTSREVTQIKLLTLSKLQKVFVLKVNSIVTSEFLIHSGSTSAKMIKV